MKIAALAADSILALHTAVVIFAVFGGLLILLDWRFAIIHVPIVVWSSVVNLANWTCPLTPLEQRLRVLAGQSSFQGGWLQHYLEPLVRPLGMPRRMELIAGTSVLVWNLFLYSVILWVQAFAISAQD